MNNTERAAKQSLAALERIEQGILNQIEELQAAVPVDRSAVGEAIKQLKVIMDLVIAKTWTLEIQDAIKSNPANALPPGSLPGSVSQRFKELAGLKNKKEHRDQRRSANRPMGHPGPPPDWGFSLPGTPPRPTRGDGVILPE